MSDWFHARPAEQAHYSSRATKGLERPTVDAPRCCCRPLALFENCDVAQLMDEGERGEVVAGRVEG